jgi:hypothetical protein
MTNTINYLHNAQCEALAASYERSAEAADQRAARYAADRDGRTRRRAAGFRHAAERYRAAAKKALANKV